MRCRDCVPGTNCLRDDCPHIVAMNTVLGCGYIGYYFYESQGADPE